MQKHGNRQPLEYIEKIIKGIGWKPSHERNAECEDKMTKIEMLNQTLKKYKELKEAHYNSLWLAQRAKEKNDCEMVEIYKQMANEYWIAANHIELLADTIFPNVDFFDLYLDTI